jgi:hypothetical protein
MAFFGFNTAGNGFGDRSDEGLLVINHEYINPEYFYAPGSDAANWMLPFTFEKARKAQAAHGVSVVHVARKADGSWEPPEVLALQPPHPRQHADDDPGPGGRPRADEDRRRPQPAPRCWAR